MAIDPKKMGAWLGNEESTSTAPPKKGSAKPTKEPPKEEPETEEEEKAEGSLEEEFPKLFQLLEDNGQAIEESLDELDGDLLSDPETDYSADPEALSVLMEAVDALPDDVAEAIKEELKGVEHDKVLEIAQALEAGDHVVDADKFAGFLFHAAAMIEADTEEEPEETEEEPEEELVEEEPEEG